MKKHFLLLIILTIVSCKKDIVENYTIFSGKIENNNYSELKINDIYGKLKKTIKISKDGTFSETIYNTNGFNKLEFGKFEYAEVFLKNEYNLFLTIDAKNLYDKSYSGKGSIINNYLAKKDFLLYKKYEVPTKLYFEESEKNFIEKLTDFKLEVKDLLSNSDIPTEFEKSEKVNFKYQYTHLLKMYQLMRKIITNNKDFKVSNSFPKIDYNITNDEHFKKYESYVNLVKFKHNTDVQNLMKENDITNTEASLIQLKKLKSGVIKDFFINDLADKITITNPESKKIYDGLVKLSNNDEFKNRITDKFKKMKALLKGNLSPVFENFINYTGGTNSLSDFKGKYIYIDVWATWCGPCLKEVPYLKELEKKYHDKNITFLSISVDQKRDYDEWKKMVSDKKMGGIQLFADQSFSSSFFREYNISNIPRFILIDPKGNIISADAPRPSDKKLTALFNELKI